MESPTAWNAAHPSKAARHRSERHPTRSAWPGTGTGARARWCFMTAAKEELEPVLIVDFTLFRIG